MQNLNECEKFENNSGSCSSMMQILYYYLLEFLITERSNFRRCSTWVGSYPGIFLKLLLRKLAIISSMKRTRELQINVKAVINYLFHKITTLTSSVGNIYFLFILGPLINIRRREISYLPCGKFLCIMRCVKRANKLAGIQMSGFNLGIMKIGRNVELEIKINEKRCASKRS